MENNVCVVGLGYVGLPIAVRLFDIGFCVYGVDVDRNRLADLKNGIDHTEMIPHALMDVYAKDIYLQTEVPGNCMTYIVCVPTPDKNGVPDYSYVVSAARSIGRVAPAGATVILESTVAPSTTETLFQASVLEHSRHYDLHFAYSPERVNPGPGAYDEMFEAIKVYGTRSVVASAAVKRIYSEAFAGIVGFSDPAVTELAKCFENFQRDMNIAMMNELSMACHASGIPFDEVVAALRLKTTSPVFNSGMVGGHCIPVDPFYLADWYKNFLKEAGKPLPLVSRELHQDYEDFVTDTVRKLADTYGEPVLILGSSYKRDTSDTRNSGPLRLAQRLQDAGVAVQLLDLHIGTAATLPDNVTYAVVVGAVNHALTPSTALMLHLPIDQNYSVFVNLDRFTAHQTNGFTEVIDL